MKVSFLRVTIIVTFLFFTMGITVTAHADFEGLFQTYPLPIKVEGDIIPTKCYLTLKVYEFKQPCSAVFPLLTTTSPELTLKNILISIKQNKLQAFMDLSDAGGSSEGIFTMYRTAFDGCDDPILVRRFDLGALSYFLLDVGKESFPIVPILIIRKENKFLQSYNSIGHAVCQNVSALSRALISSPRRFLAIADPHFNTEISLLPLFGETQQNPVYFRFTGSNVAYSLFLLGNSSTETEICPPELNHVLQLYRNINYVLTAETTERYAGFFGPKSKPKVLRFLDRMKSNNPKQFEAYLEMHSSYRQVSYVISSDSLYILFYQSCAGDYKAEGLQYDMLFDYPNAGMKRVNFFFEANVDSLLQWPQFAGKFITKVINAKK